MKHLLRDISMLPSPTDLRGKLQSLAMLDAILMPDWEMRFFSFNAKWGIGEMTSSMRDGEGSEFFFLFNAAGVAGKIYCKRSALGPSAVSEMRKIPGDFSSFVEEPAFNVDLATCYLWQRLSDRTWSVAPESTVEIPLLAFVSDQGEYYRAWAENYYEKKLDLNLVKAVFRQQVLTNELIESINPEREINAALADSQEISYPH